MGKYFGTDGVRGVANESLTPEFAFKLGRCGGYILTKDRTDTRPKVVIGRDTRVSGQLLEGAIIAGLLSIGVDVVRLGVISTPGVAYLTRTLEANAGVMISASHNPFEDNGIKFFGSDGFKLSDAMEGAIEALLDLNEDPLPRPVGTEIGTVIDDLEGKQKYIAYLKSTVSQPFDGMKIVLDCAHGAAGSVAPQLFVQLGAETIVIGNEPNGFNINQGCGSTSPERIQDAVIEHQADAGLAFDGDADRLIAIDEKGNLIDGDQILFVLARVLLKKGRLKQNTVVSTLMSNLGFYKALEKNGIRSKQTKVGDRYVIEEMRNGGYNLGGEQSGHIILLDYNTTGDGILSALQLLQAIKEENQPLSELAAAMSKYPQFLINVPIKNKAEFDTNQRMKEAIHSVEKRLGEHGRILVRPSGTEPLVRVMAEGSNEPELLHCIERIVEVIHEEFVQAVG